MLSDSAYFNALLLTQWKVCQKLNHVSSVQISHSVHAFITCSEHSKPLEN